MIDHPYIAIEGVIGVGKTTLARLLKESFQAELILEVTEENPFLSDFYGDRARFAFQTQIFFLLSRYRQLQQGFSQDFKYRGLISDYVFAKDRLFAGLNLNMDELEMYERVYGLLTERLRPPALVIYLKADLDILMHRIAVRDRPYERAMERDYISQLREAYEELFRNYTEAPVLFVDTNHLDYVHRTEDLRTIIHQIQAALGEAPQQKLLPLEDEYFTTQAAPTAAAPVWPSGAATAAPPVFRQPVYHPAEMRRQFMAMIETAGQIGGLLRRMEDFEATEPEHKELPGQQNRQSYQEVLSELSLGLVHCRESLDGMSYLLENSRP